ncbi:unnamed protein product [Blepharisma stoltei]|uniref:Uncharacterized protein n=1 Tax=Blepharisma stoltei TaxID=1481888 RepID=A0AAU9IKM2_9CILI|nr:unnamed protein product [Blepharisma stoltei]
MGCCQASHYRAGELSFMEIRTDVCKNSLKMKNEESFVELSILSNNDSLPDTNPTKSDENFRFFSSTFLSMSGFQSGIESAFLSSPPISIKGSLFKSSSITMTEPQKMLYN